MEMVPIGSGSGTVWRSGLLGIGVAFLDEVCHWGRALRFQMLKPGQCVFLFLLCAYPDVELSATSVRHFCLPAHASHPDDSGLTSEMQANPN